jgi:hypothetical protein
MPYPAADIHLKPQTRLRLLDWQKSTI